MVGAGEMGEGVIRALADRGPSSVVVANRTRDHGESSHRRRVR